MAGDNTWRNRFPGAGAAENVRKILRRRLQEIEAGEIEEVQKFLRRQPWLKDIDLNGVPDEVIVETREILGEGEAALRRDNDVATARDAIQRALVMW